MTNSCMEFGIQQQLSTPCWPQTSVMGGLKRLRMSQELQGRDWRQLQARTSIGVSLSMLIYERILIDKLSVVTEIDE